MTPPNNQINVDARLVAANTKFGFNLFNTLSKQQPNKNIFISPTSVALALSMTYNGVSGETKQEMTKVLEFTGMTPQEINAANQALQNSLQKVDPNVQVSIANSLWIKQGFSLNPEFLQKTQQYYQTNISEIDFQSPQEALSIIKNWVSKITQGKIDKIVTKINPNTLWFLINAIQGFSLKPELLQKTQQYYPANISEIDFQSPQEALSIINNWVSKITQGKINKIVNSINPNTLLFLINAIYFKGNWETPFDKSKTAKKTFYLTDSSSKQHPMMSQKGPYRCYETDTFQAVSLPYGNKGALSMYIFLPNSNTNLATFLQQLTPENWNQWMENFRGKLGIIEIPRFKIEYEVELQNTLTALGLAGIFDSSKADFSPMTDDNVAVDSVKHKTFVEVNEEGTEAGAVSSIRLSRSVGSLFQMNVNRPFFCAIRDHTTGTILFMGTIVDPQ